MKPFKVVCIADGHWFEEGTRKKYKGHHPIMNEIYTVIDIFDKFYKLDGYPLYSYNPKDFRPVDEQYGEIICELFEQTHFKDYQYSEAIKRGEL